MTVLDYILDGIEAELALERELGVRFVECDRGVLAAAKRDAEERLEARDRNVAFPLPVAPNGDATFLSRAKETSTTTSPSHDLRQPTSDARTVSPSQPSTSTSTFPFVFLHHAPLGEAGLTMMTKIVEALGQTLETAPIVTEAPVPKAKIYVILGGLALRKFQPKLKGVPGQWLKTERGADVLVTYSPEYILRFKTVTPAVKKLKTDMWHALKEVARRAG